MNHTRAPSPLATARPKNSSSSISSQHQQSSASQGLPQIPSSSKPRASTDQPSRSSIDKRGPPPSEKTRVWHDRSGQFRVEAAFLGFANGKIRLHKVNGVVIEVPSEKMSVEDMRFVERVTGRPQTQPQRRASDDDDEPLAHRRSSLKAPPRSATAPPSAAAAQAQATPPATPTTTKAAVSPRPSQGATKKTPATPKPPTSPARTGTKSPSTRATSASRRSA